MAADNPTQPANPPESGNAITRTEVDDAIGRANAGDIDAQFVVNLVRDRQMIEAGRVPAGHDGLIPVYLTPTPVPAERWILPHVYRSMNAVDVTLRNVMRDLVTGRLPWPLYLHGPAGAGKTRACLALLDFVLGSKYTTVAQAMTARMNDEPLPWERPAPLVALDEIGTRTKVRDLEYGVVVDCFESREWIAAPAIYISNLDPTDLAKLYDDRVASRLLSGSTFRLDGNDRREKS